MQNSESQKARHVQPFAFLSGRPAEATDTDGPSFAEFVARRNSPVLPVSATHPSLVEDVPEDIT